MIYLDLKCGRSKIQNVTNCTTVQKKENQKHPYFGGAGIGAQLRQCLRWGGAAVIFHTSDGLIQSRLMGQSRLIRPIHPDHGRTLLLRYGDRSVIFFHRIGPNESTHDTRLTKLRVSFPGFGDLEMLRGRGRGHKRRRVDVRRGASAG